MLLRPATLEDANLLFQWRNDPETRKNSHNRAEVPYDNHVAWLKSTLSNARRTLLVAVDSLPIGAVRYDWESETPPSFALSWTVAPEHRGRGLGTQMVAEVVKSQRVTIVAEIKNSNVPSIRIVQKNGFVPLADKGELTHWIRRLEQ